MNYWMCLKCRDSGHHYGGWYGDSSGAGALVCPLGHGGLWGPYPTWDPRLPINAHLNAQANWRRLIEKVAQIVEGSFDDCLPIQAPYYLEMLDPLHRYGPEAKLQFDTWAAGDRKELFLDWLEKQPLPPSVKGVIQVPSDKLVASHQIRFNGERIVVPARFPLDWRQAIESGRYHELIFVMDAATYMYVGIKVRGRFQHSSFFGGRPVKMAGMLHVDSSWRIRGVSNASGHYAPGPAKLADFLSRLKDRGFNLAALDLQYWDGRAWAYNGKAKPWLDQQPAAMAL